MNRRGLSGALTALLILASAATAHAMAFEFGLGINEEYFAYQEQLTAPAKSTETAIFPSAVGLVRWYILPESFLQLRAEYITGVQSQYSGTALTSGQSVQTVDPLAFTNYEVDSYLALSDHFSIYVGYGYRNWNRFLSGGLGYREIYTWNYTPVGVLVWTYKELGFEWGVDLSARPTSNGVIQVITSQTQSGGQDSQMNLGSTTGYKLMVPMRLRSGSWSLLVTPWYERSSIGQSNLVTNTTLSPTANTYILEPNSQTDQIGVDGIITYMF